MEQKIRRQVVPELAPKLHDLGGASAEEIPCQCRGRERLELHQEDPLEEGVATCSSVLA